MIPSILEHSNLLVEQGLSENIFTKTRHTVSHGISRLLALSTVEEGERKALDEFSRMNDNSSLFLRYTHRYIQDSLVRRKSLTLSLEMMQDCSKGTLDLDRALPRLKKIVLLSMKALSDLEQADVPCLSSQSERKSAMEKMSLAFEVSKTPSKVKVKERDHEAKALFEISQRFKEQLTVIETRLRHVEKGSDLECELLQLNDHLKRLSQVPTLMETFPKQTYLMQHMHQMLSASQYTVEHLGHIASLEAGTQTRSHNLLLYKNLFSLGASLNPKLEDLMKQIDTRKGVDYPFWTYYSQTGKQAKGMGMLSQACELAELEEGFVPGKLKSYPEMRHNYVRFLSDISELTGALLKEQLVR